MHTVHTIRYLDTLRRRENAAQPKIDHNSARLDLYRSIDKEAAAAQTPAFAEAGSWSPMSLQMPKKVCDLRWLEFSQPFHYSDYTAG